MYNIKFIINTYKYLNFKNASLVINILFDTFIWQKFYI